MDKKLLSLRADWEHFCAATVRFTTGGSWAASLPGWARHNLSWFWLDGFFSAACDNIVTTYLVLYILAMGASSAQIGLMSSLTNLVAGLLLLPGAVLVERQGHRKQICLVGGALSRVVLVLLAALPMVLGGQTLIYIAIVVSVSRDAFTNLIYPAWMSITGDIVPLIGRGRFFASRNFIMGVAGMATTFLIGEVITHSGQPLGYQIALLIAFGLGVASTISFARLRDPVIPANTPKATPLAIRALVRDLKIQPGFLALLGTTALWNFSVNVPGPFFNVYLVRNLHATASMVGATCIATSFAALLVQPRLGALADRWGARRLQLMSGLLIPIVPVAWVFAQTAWHIIPINLLSGALWAVYNLAAFNYLLALIPDDMRARFSAVYQVVVLFSLSIGAAVGSLLLNQFGYAVIFWGSGVGRLAAALLFAIFSIGLVDRGGLSEK
jgi:MFS family permease